MRLDQDWEAGLKELVELLARRRSRRAYWQIVMRVMTTVDRRTPLK